MPLNGRFVLVLLAALVGAALTARLGVWQLNRAQGKLDLQAQIDGRGALPSLPIGELARSAGDAAAQHYRRISLRGQWLADRTIYLDNRQMGGHPGFFVVTPLLLGPGDAVLVQRGWAPRNALDRTRLPVLATPTGEVELQGRVAPPPSQLFEFGAAESGTIRQNLALDAVAREIGIALRPLSIQQLDAPGAADGLLRQWPAFAADVGKHQGYAFQWFALCALIVGSYAWFQLIRPRRHSAA